MEYVGMLQVALRYVHVLRRERAQYEEYRSWWIRRGQLPPYCPHGQSLWTEHDPICGRCEDGEPNLYQQALDLAREAAQQAAHDIQVELLRRAFEAPQANDTP